MKMLQQAFKSNQIRKFAVRFVPSCCKCMCGRCDCLKLGRHGMSLKGLLSTTGTTLVRGERQRAARSTTVLDDCAF